MERQTLLRCSTGMRRRCAWLSALTSVVVLAGSCTAGGDNDPAEVQQERPETPSTSESQPFSSPPPSPDSCEQLKSDDGPVTLGIGKFSELPADSIVRDSELPRAFPSPAEIRATATPLMDDLPGQVRMIAFWGEPGSREPDSNTPVSFLGIDGRWRQIARSQLDGGRSWIDSGDNSLSPDGSRWVIDSVGQTKMFDFATGEMIALSKAKNLYSAWSPDSQTVALWNPLRNGIETFDLSGNRVAKFPLAPDQYSVYVSNGGSVTSFVQSTHRAPVIRYTTQTPDGTRVEQKCDLPLGFLPSQAFVEGYDGRYIWLDSLNRSSGEFIYRNAVIDTMTGTVVEDVANKGECHRSKAPAATCAPYIANWLKPGVLLSTISDGADGIYAVDPEGDSLVRISRISLYRQAGYANHANDQFARDLIFGKR